MRKLQINHLDKLNKISKVINTQLPEVAAYDSVVQFISTGDLSLDHHLGGGIPIGRTVEIFGKESSGKTALALSIIKQAQILGFCAAFIDVEHKMNSTYLYKAGIKVGELLYACPSTGYEAIKLLKELILTGYVKLIVLDSVAALNYDTDIESNTKQTVAITNQFYSLLSETKHIPISLILLNQVRTGLSHKETSVGSRDFKAYCSMRLGLQRISQIKFGDLLIGTRHEAIVLKNKTTITNSAATFDVFIDGGVSKESGLVELGINYGVIKQQGSWYIILDKELKGRMACIKYLQDNPDVCLKLEIFIKEKLDKA